MRLCLCLVFLIGMLQPVWAATQVDWQDLIDRKVAEFEDPFASLSVSELRSLGTVIRLRENLAKPDLATEDRLQIEDRLERLEAKLAVSGIDVDWLLSQRKTIGRKRAKAAMAGNSNLDGKEIAIPGYVIPVLDADSEMSTSGYLVPERGMCSHMPAPDPNQMIRYTLATEWQADSVYEPVRLTGTLSIRPTKQEITLLDGQIEMIAVFDMTVTRVTPLAEQEPVSTTRSFLDFLKSKSQQQEAPANQ